MRARCRSCAQALLEAQYDLFQNGRFPVIVLVGGMDGRGKARTINLLNEWMDPRHIAPSLSKPVRRGARQSADVALLAGTAGEGKVGILFGHW